MARVWKFGADVDTDQIVPGRYAPYMTIRGGAGQVPVHRGPARIRRRRCAPGDIIVAGQ